MEYQDIVGEKDQNIVSFAKSDLKEFRQRDSKLFRSVTVIIYGRTWETIMGFKGKYATERALNNTFRKWESVSIHWHKSRNFPVKLLQSYINTDVCILSENSIHHLVSSPKWHIKSIRRLMKFNLVPGFTYMFDKTEYKSTLDITVPLALSFDDMKRNKLWIQQKKFNEKYPCFIPSLSSTPTHSKGGRSQGVWGRDVSTTLSLASSSGLYQVCTFDTNAYRVLNFDLRCMTPYDLFNHFIDHGYLRERRLFFYPKTASIMGIQPISKHQCKCERIIILNHSSGLTGAPWVAYGMFMEMYNDENVDAYMFTPEINVKMIQKFAIADHVDHTDYIDGYKKSLTSNILEYYHNPYAIIEWIKILKPTTILVNSFASEFLEFDEDSWKSLGIKLIYYTHEDPKHYIPNQVDKVINVDEIWCADHKTSILTKEKNSLLPVIVYPPKFREETLNGHLDRMRLYKGPPFSVWKRLKWSLRPVVAMIGEQSERKNFNGFLDIARKLLGCEFIWIGGDAYKSGMSNVTVIPQTPHVLEILNKYVDYFLLTSELDHCPVVFLEALLVNLECIYFSENVGYSYPECDLIHRIEGNVKESTNKINQIRKIINGKRKRKNDKRGTEYIKKHFMYSQDEVSNKMLNMSTSHLRSCDDLGLISKKMEETFEGETTRFNLLRNIGSGLLSMRSLGAAIKSIKT